MLEEDAVMAAAASSECSSGCQSGWTTYLDDDSSSYSRGTAGFRGKGEYCRSSYHCGHSEEEDDLSMISDASSGPRQQLSAGSDEGAAALAYAQRAESRRRTKEPAAAAARWQSKMGAVASTLLEDTASSPAFFKHSAKVMGSPEANGYGAGACSMMDMSNAADFSSSFFSATTGFESPLGGSPLGGRYLQVQYSPAPAKPMPTSRQAFRDGGDKMERW